MILTVALALTTLGADALFSQGRQSARNRRTVMLDGREVVEGEVLVRYRAQTGRIERERAEFQADSGASEAIGRRGARRLRSSGLSTRQMLTALRANPDVEFAEPNFIIRASAVPNDPSMDSLWGLINIGQNVDGQAGVPGADIAAAAAWDVTTGSRATVIAIIDSGIDFNHPDLAANVFSAPRQFSVTIGSTTITCAAGTHGFNALTSSCVPNDDNGHGTHVAGIVGAVGNNNVGVTGVNWTANLMALKILDAAGTGTTADAVKAIEFAIKTKAALGADANVRVLNASWGGATFSQTLNEEIEAANSADMLFVAAAGTAGTNNDAMPHYPASSTSSNVISVAAVDNTGELASFSNYGATSVHLAAPGATTLSTFPDNNYGELSGTSMSAPYVAGAAALVLSVCPSNTATLKSRLLASVDPDASLSGKTISGGRLNVNNAVRACAEANPVPTVTALSPFRAAINGPSFTMTVTGTGFVGTSTVMLNGAARSTTFVSSTELRATIFAGDITSLGTRAITVANPSPGGGTSGSATLTVTPPVELTVNGTTGPLTVLPGAVLTVVIKNGPANPWDYLTVVPLGSPADTWTGDYRFLNGTTTPPDPGMSEATVNKAVPTTPGSYELRFLANGWYDRLATSGAITVSSSNPVPSITSLSPSSVAAGSASFTLSVSGTGFTSASVVRVNGSSRPTTYVSATALSAAIAQADVASAGTAAITVFNPSPGGGTSNTAALTIGAPPPAPTLSGISPTTLPAGGPAFTLNVTGTNFATNSQVQVNGSARPTTFVSNTSLTAALTESDRASAGSRTITVVTPAPGGGTSGSVALMVTAATMTVNGSSGAISVSPGAALSVSVAGGPANSWDYLTVVPVGSPADHWTGSYKFLNGTTTAPNPGLSSATVNLSAPSTPGSYEVRFNANGWYTRLATSGVITVATQNPVPSLTSISPTTATAGQGGFTMTVNGSGFTAASQVLVNGAARSTTYQSSTRLTAAIPAGDVASAGTRTITVFNPEPGGGTSGGATLSVVQPPPPGSTTMTVNGTTSAITVAPGSAMTVVVSNGPGHSWDYLTVVPVGSPADTWTGQYQFLNGTTTPPNPGLTNATVSVPAPTTPGQYELRFNAEGWYTRIATSGVITVTAPAASGPSMTVNGTTGPITVAKGSTLTVSVANGPGNQWDYVTIVPAGSPSDTWTGVYKFLNNTTSAPSVGMTGGTVTLPVPTTPGNYEVRFNADGWYTRLATSGVITVSP